MRFRDLTIILVCVLTAIGCLFIAGSRLDDINQQRVDMKLIVNEPIKNAPPSLAFATVAMGAFRGLVVDILWVRADNLKQKGEFFDAKQLADWITVLQPRFESVWIFQAWNMAYNISAAIPATQPQERWKWVRNGYELIRDKGLVINPKSLKLYRELAWIFQHKIGGYTDDDNRYYKLQIATAMERILGVNPSKSFFKALKDAPANLDDFIRDANAGEFINKLRNSCEEFKNTKDIISKYFALRNNPSAFDPNTFAVLAQYRNSEDKIIEKFDIFVRAWQLRNKWKLEPELMIECNNLYGPVTGDDANDHQSLDWRHPDCHAIYWAHKGLEVASGNPNTVTELNADRIVMHSIQNLFRYGRIYIYDEPVEIEQKQFSGDKPVKIRTIRRTLYLRPEPRMFESYHQLLLRVIDKYRKAKDSRVKAIKNGHRNMLENAVLSYYQAGNKAKAAKIYKMLREFYPDREEAKKSLLDFCRTRLKNELEIIGINSAREIIISMLREGYFRFVMEDEDEAYGREAMAKEIYNNYQKKFTVESQKNSGVNRVLLPPFDRMRFLALIDFIYDESIPRSLREILLNMIEVKRPKLYKELIKQGQALKKETSQKSDNK